MIEWRENGVGRRQSVGAIPSDVLAEAQRKRAAMNAQADGIEIVAEDPAADALYLKDAVAKYLNEVEMNRSRSTFIHYRHTLDLFKAGGPAFEFPGATTTGVPRPCVLCKGGYDAADTMCCSTYASMLPTL